MYCIHSALSRQQPQSGITIKYVIEATPLLLICGLLHKCAVGVLPKCTLQFPIHSIICTCHHMDTVDAIVAAPNGGAPSTTTNMIN